jgi:hypothetical protein
MSPGVGCGATAGAQETGLDPERERLRQSRERGIPWRRFGPYLAERQWGTVREDYSASGDAWDEFTHEHARSRAYRWGEDGLLGICDDQGLLCLALALWNEADPILKERLFGLTGREGNHGEDVKEYYFFQDATPTHSYLKALYRYPQRAFPYAQLVEENRRRSPEDPELEIGDTDAFADNRFFDVEVEYAKADPEDIIVRISVINRGPEAASLHLLPTLWFRNTWSWGSDDRRPGLSLAADPSASLVRASHHALGEYWLACQGSPELLFTENETNYERVWGLPSRSACPKDGIHDAVVLGRRERVNSEGRGSKVAAHYRFSLAAGERVSVLLRLSATRHARPFDNASHIVETRAAEADRFYAPLAGPGLSAAERLVQRQAFAGLLWSQQFYFYDVDLWLLGDPVGPPPPQSRLAGRNVAWRHLNNADVLLMPDTWEYPWYAAWDLAFHCVALAPIDPELAKQQLILILREWYMHPNGQLPAYEWAFGEVNPPVHAWAAMRVYQIERRLTGRADRAFLERVFQKLLLNFTWWVNRKDRDGRNVFEGGFLGLDNIGIFDRNRPPGELERLEQADGTAWMGRFCLDMLAIALELAYENRVYEDLATKFFEHFLYIAGALNNLGNEGISLWDEADEFFYDALQLRDGTRMRLKVRSLVGLTPLFAVMTIEPRVLQALPDFAQRMNWFLDNRPALAGLVSRWQVPGRGERRLLALVRGHRMKCLLRRTLDPAEFLGEFGVRALSRHHLEHPFQLRIGDAVHTLRYEPGESRSGMFGGNSNWRGPIWFPVNFLLIESLQQFHHYYGDDFRVEHPTGSGEKRTLWEIAEDLSMRLIRIFLPGADGRRPVHGGRPLFDGDLWREMPLFYEYFDGDSGAGLGASHQTGWTALVAKLLEQRARFVGQGKGETEP